MSYLNTNYRIEEGPHGYKTIHQSGRCTADSKPDIKQDLITRWQWAVVPQTQGAVFKSLDGQTPVIKNVYIETVDQTFTCVKIGALVTKFAPQQSVGLYAGQYILYYEITWQEVGDLP